MHGRRGRISRGIDLGPREHPEGPVVAGPLADGLLEALHRLDVVVEDVRAGLHHGPQRLLLAVEVGDEHLDAHARASRARSARMVAANDAGAAVGQVVAGDAA